MWALCTYNARVESHTGINKCFTYIVSHDTRDNVSFDVEKQASKRCLFTINSEADCCQEENKKASCRPCIHSKRTRLPCPRTNAASD